MGGRRSQPSPPCSCWSVGSFGATRWCCRSSPDGWTCPEPRGRGTGPLYFDRRPASMGPMPTVDLTEAWTDLLRRRAAFAPALAIYDELIRLWATTPIVVAPLQWDAAACARCW